MVTLNITRTIALLSPDVYIGVKKCEIWPKFDL